MMQPMTLKRVRKIIKDLSKYRMEDYELLGILQAASVKPAKPLYDGSGKVRVTLDIHLDKGTVRHLLNAVEYTFEWEHYLRALEDHGK